MAKKDGVQFNKGDAAKLPVSNRALNEVEGLGLDDALKIAYGNKSDAEHENNVSAEDYSLQIEDHSVNNNLAYTPVDMLSGKKAIKSTFSTESKTDFSKTAKEQYADVTLKALADIKNRQGGVDGTQGGQASIADRQVQGEIGSPITRKEILEDDKQAAKTLKHTRRAYKPNMRAHGDYDLQGDINGTIAKNESYIRQAQFGRHKRRVIALVIIILFLLFLVTFGISVIISNTTGFTVKMTGNDASKGLTLYDNAALSNGTGKLSITGIPECNNQTYSEILDNIVSVVDKGDGQQSREFYYFAYSFYVQNAGNGIIDFDFKLTMSAYSKGMDQAIRIMVINDSSNYFAKDNKRVLTSYAKPTCHPETGAWLYDSNNNPIMQQISDPEGNLYPQSKQDNPTPFYSNDTPVYLQYKNLSNKPGENLLKYTVVIYLEGGDPDCVNAIWGGGVKGRIELAVTDYRLVL